MKLVIVGGHHTSALPVIQDLKNRIPDIDLVWFGHKYSMKGDKNPTLEYQDITGMGLVFENLQAGKFYKTYSPSRLVKIPFGFIHALYLLLKHRPNGVVSFGGYLAVPVVIVAKLLGIPSVTHEQTVVTGWANKLISRFADKILLSWPSSANHFKGKNYVVTGLPLRESVLHSTSSNFVFENDLPVIYVTGGKTGGHKINLAILESLETLLSKYNVIHQCGANSVFNDLGALSGKYTELKPNVKGSYYLQPFISNEEIGEVFAKSDLVISRSGAHVTYELLYLGKPAILIPIPWVSHNEQYLNAKVLEEAGLGIILEEKHLTSQNLLEKITYFFDHTQNFKRDTNVTYTDNSEVVSKIVDEILSTVS